MNKQLPKIIFALRASGDFLSPKIWLLAGHSHTGLRSKVWLELNIYVYVYVFEYLIAENSPLLLKDTNRLTQENRKLLSGLDSKTKPKLT